MNDLIDRIAEIRVEFIRFGMKPPAIIILENADEGRRFLQLVNQDTVLFKNGPRPVGIAIELGGITYQECTVHGMKVRWPVGKR